MNVLVFVWFTTLPNLSDMNTLRFTAMVYSMHSFFIHTVPPSIITPPMQRVIAVVGNEQDTTFVCQATGFPTPQISWLHNGQNISQTTDERFQVGITEAGGSRLSITQLRGNDSGSIKCIASSMVDIPNEQPLARNTSSITTLSVLGKYFTCSVVP